MNEVLAYMKAAIEGHAGLVPFARWFAEHATEIETLCGRGSYLRIKHNNPLAEFRHILSKHEISFIDSPNAYLPRGPGEDFSWIKLDWLTERVFPYRRSPTSFGTAPNCYIDEYLHMIDIKETGDELWHYSSSKESCTHNVGSAGIALVRDGKVIYAIVLMQLIAS